MTDKQMCESCAEVAAGGELMRQKAAAGSGGQESATTDSHESPADEHCQPAAPAPAGMPELRRVSLGEATYFYPEKDIQALIAFASAETKRADRASDAYAEVCVALVRAGITSFGYATDAIKELKHRADSEHAARERLQIDLGNVRGSYNYAKEHLAAELNTDYEWCRTKNGPGRALEWYVREAVERMRAEHAARVAAEHIVEQQRIDLAFERERNLEKVKEARQRAEAAERALEEATRMASAIIVAAGGEVKIRPSSLVKNYLLQRTDCVEDDCIVYTAVLAAAKHKEPRT